MRKISFSLSEKSIDRAIEKLIEHKQLVDSKCDELASRLATLGATVSSLGFSRAFYDGNNDVEITVTQSRNGYVVHAQGEAVCFIEFGTGVGATSPHGAELGFTPGSWSIDHKKEFSTYGFWYYNGHRISGSQPGNYMYNAGKEMLEQVTQIAKEVFKK